MAERSNEVKRRIGVDVVKDWAWKKQVLDLQGFYLFLPPKLIELLFQFFQRFF